MTKKLTITISDEMFEALPEFQMPRQPSELNLSDEELVGTRLATAWQNRLIGKAGRDAMQTELNTGRAAAQTAIQNKRAELNQTPAVVVEIQDK